MFGREAEWKRMLLDVPSETRCSGFLGAMVEHPLTERELESVCLSMFEVDGEDSRRSSLFRGTEHFLPEQFIQNMHLG